MKKFENFCKALDNLRIVQDISEPYDILSLTGGVALFEICFEQAWKAMKEILADQGYSESATGSPKQILKLAYSAGMIQDEQEWLVMLSSRNDATHSYNEEVALRLICEIKADYISLFETLKEELNSNWL